MLLSKIPATHNSRVVSFSLSKKCCRITCIGLKVGTLGPVVQSPISANLGLTLNKTYGVNPGLALIGL